MASTFHGKKLLQFWGFLLLVPGITQAVAETSCPQRKETEKSEVSVNERAQKLAGTGNAMLERMFSRMACVKSDWRGQLNWDRLDALLCVGVEGPSCKDFDCNPGIDSWFEASIWQLTSSSQRYLEKQRRFNDSGPKFDDLSDLVVSNLEDKSESK